MTTAATNNEEDDLRVAVGLLEQLVYGRKPSTTKPNSQLRRDYFEKHVALKPLSPEDQFLSDFDPAKYSQDPTTKRVNLSSRGHISQLKKTIEHLEHLKTVFKAGSANRMVVTQACSKLRLLLRRLESKNTQST